jgi:hypothetical protein
MRSGTHTSFKDFLKEEQISEYALEVFPNVDPLDLETALNVFGLWILKQVSQGKVVQLDAQTKSYRKGHS